MSEFLQKYPLTPGTPVQIDSSKSSSIAYDFINNSPYDVDIAWGIGNKPVSFSIPPTTIWRGASPLSALLIPGNQWTGIIIATPSNPLGGTPPANLSAAQLTVTGYAKGAEPTEQVTTLNTQTTIGGGALAQTSSVVQTGQPIPTSVVVATPSASFMGAILEALINNDGSARFGHIGVGNPAIFWDSAGNVTVLGSLSNVAPLKLISGNQLNGVCGGIQDNGIGGHVVGTMCNFGTQLTNVWTSITLTPVNFTNETGPSADQASVYGLRVLWSVTANGLSTFTANFVTVGN